MSNKNPIWLTITLAMLGFLFGFRSAARIEKREAAKICPFENSEFEFCIKGVGKEFACVQKDSTILVCKPESVK